MRKLLSIFFLFPFSLYAEAVGRSGGEVEYASLIGGSGNFGEEAFLTLLIVAFLFLISQWIKYSNKMKFIKPLEVLPHLERGEMVPILTAGNLRLIPELFEEDADDFELFWRLESGSADALGRIGFLMFNPTKKSVQLFFEVSSDVKDDSAILSLMEKACAYIWAEWEESEIQVIHAYIEDSDLLGEAILGSLGFVESGNEANTIEFSSYRK